MAKAAVALKEPEAAPRKIALKPHKMQAKEQVSRDFWVTVEDAHTPDDLLSPDYWGHVARKLVKNTIIWAGAENGKWMAILWVYDSGDTWAKTRMVQFNDYRETEQQGPDPANYKVDHIEGSGWRVLHVPTQKLLATGLATERAAQEFVNQQMKV